MTRRASGRWRPSRVQLKTTFGAYVSLSWQSLMYMFTLLVCFFFFSRLSCLQIHSVSVVLNLQIATWATDDIQTSSEVHKCCKCVFFLICCAVVLSQSTFCCVNCVCISPVFWTSLSIPMSFIFHVMMRWWGPLIAGALHYVCPSIHLFSLDM